MRTFLEQTMLIGDRIRAIREAKKLSQGDMNSVLDCCTLM